MANTEWMRNQILAPLWFFDLNFAGSSGGLSLGLSSQRSESDLESESVEGALT